jgi:phage repressor protein C with HTH and peptisase S24 domain
MKIPVDRDQPFHCDAADKKAASDPNALPVAPWIQKESRQRNGSENKQKNRDRTHDFHNEQRGGKQSGDFGKGRRDVDFSAGGGKFRRRPHNGRNMKFGRTPHRP